MDMDWIYEARRLRLLQAGHERYEHWGMQSNLCKLLGCSQNYVSRILSNPNKPSYKRIGEELARHAEEKLDKPIYWLDGNESLDHWPFKHITPERLAALDSTQIEQLESVIEPVLQILSR